MVRKIDFVVKISKSFKRIDENNNRNNNNTNNNRSL